MEGRITREGIMAAALLGGLVVGTFAVLQDYGPQSTVLGLHRAVRESSLSDPAWLAKIQPYLEPPPTPPVPLGAADERDPEARRLYARRRDRYELELRNYQVEARNLFQAVYLLARYGWRVEGSRGEPGRAIVLVSYRNQMRQLVSLAFVLEQGPRGSAQDRLWRVDVPQTLSVARENFGPVAAPGTR